MKLFTCTDHEGHYPVDVASIVLAESIEVATGMLAAHLNHIGLGGPFTLQEVDMTTSKVTVLCDGNY